MDGIFELVKVFDCELDLKQESIRVRFELFQDIVNQQLFRIKTLESDLFRLNPSFPRNEEGNPWLETDDLVWTERDLPGFATKEFTAQSIGEAVDRTLTLIRTLRS